MPENKTKATINSIAAFLEKITDKKVKEDCYKIIELMESVSGEKPVMWGSSIIGFGSYHYVYESGREGDICVIGFSPRKQNIALYLHKGIEHLKEELSSLGKYKTSGGCLYIKKLEDVDIKFLKKIISISYKEAKKRGKQLKPGAKT